MLVGMNVAVSVGSGVLVGGSGVFVDVFVGSGNGVRVWVGKSVAVFVGSGVFVGGFGV